LRKKGRRGSSVVVVVVVEVEVDVEVDSRWKILPRIPAWTAATSRAANKATRICFIADLFALRLLFDYRALPVFKSSATIGEPLAR